MLSPIEFEAQARLVVAGESSNATPSNPGDPKVSGNAGAAQGGWRAGCVWFTRSVGGRG
jgi:hypothetical protein